MTCPGARMRGRTVRAAGPSEVPSVLMPDSMLIIPNGTKKTTLRSIGPVPRMTRAGLYFPAEGSHSAYLSRKDHWHTASGPETSGLPAGSTATAGGRPAWRISAGRRAGEQSLAIMFPAAVALVDADLGL